MGERQIAGHHLYLRVMREKEEEENIRKTNNSQIQKRERFCLLISGKVIFCKELAWF